MGSVMPVRHAPTQGVGERAACGQQLPPAAPRGGAPVSLLGSLSPAPMSAGGPFTQPFSVPLLTAPPGTSQWLCPYRGRA